MSLLRDYRQISESLGHSFNRPELLVQALTHSSFANENDSAEQGSGDNEQLEFLGDAVLSLTTSEHLCQHFPKYSEGELSKLRAHLVSARHLAKVGRSLRLGNHLLLGKGEERTGGRTKPALLADCVEALIAALYLDGGLDAARTFILGVIVTPELERMGSDPAARTARTDFKSTLQEVLQAHGRPQPSYEVTSQSGPEHNTTFLIELRLNDECIVKGEGKSKKIAEQHAAELALQYLRTHSLQDPV